MKRGTVGTEVVVLSGPSPVLHLTPELSLKGSISLDELQRMQDTAADSVQSAVCADLVSWNLPVDATLPTPAPRQKFLLLNSLFSLFFCSYVSKEVLALEWSLQLEEENYSISQRSVLFCRFQKSSAITLDFQVSYNFTKIRQNGTTKFWIFKFPTFSQKSVKMGLQRCARFFCPHARI